MQTTTVTLGALVDSALYEIEHPAERGIALAMSDGNFLENDTDTQFALKLGSLKVNDLAEFGSEVVLVTARSNDVVPVYTVQRGYYDTTAVAHTAGAQGQSNPQFPRRRVAEFVNRALTRMEALGVPLITSVAAYREPGKKYLKLPADCRQVLQVMYINPTSGRVLPLDGWLEHNYVPVSISTTSHIVSLPPYVTDYDELIVVYSKPYEWTGSFPDEAATVEVPSVAVDIPAAYAAAMSVSGREVSRQQLDRVEEWNQSEPLRGNGGGALVRAKWQEFYRVVDEARRAVAVDVPNVRPKIRRPKVGV